MLIVECIMEFVVVDQMLFEIVFIERQFDCWIVVVCDVLSLLWWVEFSVDVECWQVVVMVDGMIDGWIECLEIFFQMGGFIMLCVVDVVFNLCMIDFVVVN